MNSRKEATKPGFFGALALNRIKYWGSLYYLAVVVVCFASFLEYSLNRESLLLIPWVESLKAEFIRNNPSYWIAWVTAGILLVTIAGAQSQAVLQGFLKIQTELEDTNTPLGWRQIRAGWEKANGKDTLSNMQIAELFVSSGSIVLLLALQVSSYSQALDIALLAAFVPVSILLMRYDPFSSVPYSSLVRFFLCMLLSTIAINAVRDASLSQTILWETSLRLVVTLLLVPVVVLIVLFVATVVLEFIYDRALLTLPARRKLQQNSTKMRNMASFIEFSLYIDIGLFLFSSLGLGALVYSFALSDNAVIIFTCFNVFIVAPMVSGLVLALNKSQIATAKFIRRLGVQYVLLKLIFCNVAIYVGYCLGWGAASVYWAVFSPSQQYLVPDALYLFRSISPADVPLLEQLSAFVISILVVFGLSWFMTVLALRAWKRSLVTIALSCGLVYLPDFNQEIENFLVSTLPFLLQVPKVFLLLILPSLQTFVITEVEDVTDIEHCGLTCKRCNSENSTVDARYCSFCGASLD